MKKNLAWLFMMSWSTSLICTAADDLLIEAIKQADVKKAKQALSNGADVYAIKDYTDPFTLVIFNRTRAQKNSKQLANLDAIALELIAHMPTVTINNFNLAVGGSEGSLAIVKAMRPKVTDINAADKQGITPIIASIYGYSNFDVFKYLVEQGADLHPTPGSKGLQGRKTLIELAVMPGNDKNKIVNYLLDHGVPATLENMKEAATSRHADINVIKKMAAQGIDINTPFPNGDTVFTWMLTEGSSPEVFKYFIDHGADVNGRPDDGEPYSALDTAIRLFYYYIDQFGVNLEVIKAMLKRGARVTDLTRAIAQEDIAQVTKFTQKSYEVYLPADKSKKDAVLQLLGMSKRNKKRF